MMSNLVSSQFIVAANPKCHPYYIAAILSSSFAHTHNADVADQTDWKIPAIDFTTAEETRISMTLNGMRMATEFFAHDSPRILLLIQQRLQAGQCDVVHDVLVYLWERALLIRYQVQEAKDLQAESLAAYLGLERHCIRALLEEIPLCSERIAQRIKNQEFGKVQREIDVFSLVDNLLARLQPELTRLDHEEKRVLTLIDEITSRLYHLTSHK